MDNDVKGINEEIIESLKKTAKKYVEDYFETKDNIPMFKSELIMLRKLIRYYYNLSYTALRFETYYMCNVLKRNIYPSIGRYDYLKSALYDFIKFVLDSDTNESYTVFTVNHCVPSEYIISDSVFHVDGIMSYHLVNNYFRYYVAVYFTLYYKKYLNLKQ